MLESKRKRENEKRSEFYQPEAACIIMVYYPREIHVTEVKLYVEFYVFPFSIITGLGVKSLKIRPSRVGFVL